MDNILFYEEMELQDEGNGEYRIGAGVIDGHDLIVTEGGLIEFAKFIIEHFEVKK